VGLREAVGVCLMALRQFAVWNTMQTQHGTASWAMIDEVVYVRTAHGRKATQLGGSMPHSPIRICRPVPL
jgi:hypothetical protein